MRIYQAIPDGSWVYRAEYFFIIGGSMLGCGSLTPTRGYSPHKYDAFIMEIKQ